MPSDLIAQMRGAGHKPGMAATDRTKARGHAARAAGFEHVNLDMIYGTPTEIETDHRVRQHAPQTATAA